jgi:beta-carotene hydroxylase
MVDPHTTRVQANGPVGAWRAYAGFVALPTLLLMCGVVAVWLVAIVTHATGLLPTPAAACLSFVACYVALTPAHEAAHGNVSGGRHPWLDAAVGWMAMFILLGPFPPFRELHLRHHAYTNHPVKDPDIWVAVGGASLLFRFLTILPRYYWSYSFPPEGVGSRRAETRHLAIGFFLAYMAMLAAMAWAGVAWTAVWVMMVPAWLALSVLAVVFDWLPHHPHLHRERYRNTRVIPSPFLNRMLLGQNFHLVHHLWPAIPWYHYGTVFRHTEAEVRAHGAFIVESLGDIVRKQAAR